MSSLPEKNHVFRLNGDLSQFKLDENGEFFVWMRDEQRWCNPFELKKENEIRTKIINGDWVYLFEYKDEQFTASSMDNAIDLFLDNAWGTWYDKYLEKLGFLKMDIDDIDDLKEIDNRYDDEGYYLLQQKLENGSVFQIEIWDNDDGSYEGQAQEIALERTGES